jgi:hypothetical protein
MTENERNTSMVVRFVGLVSLICAIAIASVNIQNPSDPLFFIVSGGVVADFVRIVLSSMMVAGAFYKIPKSLHAEIFLPFLGGFLLLAGLSGFFSNSYDFLLYNYIKPLDFLLLAEVGVVTNLIALEAHKPMLHFSDPYQRTFTIAVLPQLKKVKTAAA